MNQMIFSPINQVKVFLMKCKNKHIIYLNLFILIVPNFYLHVGYVCLPEADGLKDREDNEVSVSLGWTAHLTLMISSLLTVPTRYQINHLGSRYGGGVSLSVG